TPLSRSSRRGKRLARRRNRARCGVRAADRQASAAGAKRARLPRQSRARAVLDDGDALRRRGNRARDGRRSRVGIRYADGTDRARRHRRARYLRRRRTDAGRGPGAAGAVGLRRGGAGVPPAKLMTLVNAGKLGKKTGQGFYAWVNGKPQKQPAGAVPPGLAERLVNPYVQAAKAALAA